MKNDERVGEIIKKVFDTLFTEEPTYEEALVVWQKLGMYLFSYENHISRLDAVTNMLYYTKAMYKEAVTKKIIEN